MSTQNYPDDPFTSAAIIRTAFAEDQAVSTGRARALVELDEINLETPISIYFTVATTQVTATGGAVMHSFRFLVDPWMVGRQYNLVVAGSMDANGGDFWIRDTSTAMNGTEIAVDNTGALLSKGPSELLIVDSLDQFRELQVRGRVDSGADTLSLESVHRATFWIGP